MSEGTQYENGELARAAQLPELEAELAAQLGDEAAELLTSGAVSPCGPCSDEGGRSVVEALVSLAEDSDEDYDRDLALVLSHVVGSLDELREQQATLVRLAEVLIPLGEMLSDLGAKVEAEGIMALLGEGGFSALLGGGR